MAPRTRYALVFAALVLVGCTDSSGALWSSWSLWKVTLARAADGTVQVAEERIESKRDRAACELARTQYEERQSKVEALHAGLQGGGRIQKIIFMCKERRITW